MYDSRVVRTSLGILVGLSSLLIATPVQADKVRAGAGVFAKVRILGLADGTLQFRMPDGRIISQPVMKVHWVSISTDRDVMAETLSQAELHWDRDEYREAISLYEQVQNKAQLPWLRTFATMRLAMAHDRLGAFPDALRAWLALGDENPDLVPAVVLQQLPRAGSRDAARALAMIKKASHRPVSTVVLKSLRRLRKRIERGEGIVEGESTKSSGKSDRRRRGHSHTAPLSSKESAAMRQRARTALAAGDVETAARLLASARRVRNQSEREAWLLLESELECVRGRYEKSGLAAMKLVILHPRSEHVGDAWYWAGRAYEGMQRPAKALELYEQCIRHKRTSPPLRKQAQARAAALQKQVSAS